MKKLEFTTEPQICPKLLELKAECLKRGIPTIRNEALNELLLTVQIKQPKAILEIGTAFGLSGMAMLDAVKGASLTTVEKDEASFLTAKRNFEEFGYSSRIKQHLCDAGEFLNYIDDCYDFIFLDGAKARYLDYLPDLKRILLSGGVLFADNVLFRGYVDGSIKFEHRDNTIVRNMRAFLNNMLSDLNYTVSVRQIGDGILVAYKH